MSAERRMLIGLLASWLDHTRDLLHLINLKRDEMPRPIVGIGHSMGGAQLYVRSPREQGHDTNFI